jgi:hypothetical protein
MANLSGAKSGAGVGLAKLGGFIRFQVGDEEVGWRQIEKVPPNGRPLDQRENFLVSCTSILAREEGDDPWPS